MYLFSILLPRVTEPILAHTQKTQRNLKTGCKTKKRSIIYCVWQVLGWWIFKIMIKE